MQIHDVKPEHLYSGPLTPHVLQTMLESLPDPDWRAIFETPGRYAFHMTPATYRKLRMNSRSLEGAGIPLWPVVALHLDRNSPHEVLLAKDRSVVLRAIVPWDAEICRCGHTAASHDNRQDRCQAPLYGEACDCERFHPSAP